MVKPNIFFICIDAFRADRYGKNKTAKTPNIDSLVEKGIYFTQAVSCAPSTEVAISTIFTGTYPFNCLIRGGIRNTKLSSKSKSIIKKIKETGYQVHSTIPFMWNAKNFDYGFKNEDRYSVFDRLNSGVGKKIVEKLERLKNKEPWLYYVHLMDLHKPIILPENFNDNKFGNDDYDKMISYIDTWLGKIFEKINFENTIIVLTADHGDYVPTIAIDEKTISFDHKFLAKPAMIISKITPMFLYNLKIKFFLFVKNWLTKRKLSKLNTQLSPYQKRSVLLTRSDKNNFLYDELFIVPLIFAGFGINSRLNITTQIGTIDIFPTIAEMIKLEIGNTDGKSLSALLNGESREEIPIYIENNVDIMKSKGTIGIRTSKFKYFRDFNSNNNAHLYDLINDPLEEKNIINEKKEEMNKLEKILIKIQENSLDISQEEQTSQKLSRDETKKVEDELRKLGYI